MQWIDFIYTDKYEINIIGQVKNKDTGKIIKAHPDKDGYFRVVTYYNKKRKNFIVHRLIAQHFIPNPLNLPQVNHIDGNKQNNKIENLEWVTLTQNRQHAFRTGLQHGKKGLKHHNVKLTEKEVLEIRKAYDLGIKSDIISKKFNIVNGTVNKIGRRIRWKHLKEENAI